MKELPVVVPSEALKRFILDVSASLGLSSNRRQILADSLVAANLRGVDSHGVHLLPHYVRQIRERNIDTEAEGKVLTESGACLHFDGENGLGQHVSRRCCDEVVRLASIYGLGLVVARNSNHFGAAAFWAQRISIEGMVGIVMCNASPSVPPWQGKRGRIGTNPICVSVPCYEEGGWLLDMSTTTVALNKILRAAAEGETSLPEGWALDAEGSPTTDTASALKGLLMPLGGYKGSGLGMLVELLCGILGGGASGMAVGGLYILDRPMSVSQMFLAIDVSRFLSLDEFRRRVRRLVEEVKTSPTAAGFEEVLVAGDPEWRAEKERRARGIPIERSLWIGLKELAGELGIEPLEASRS